MVAAIECSFEIVIFRTTADSVLQAYTSCSIESVGSSGIEHNVFSNGRDKIGAEIVEFFAVVSRSKVNKLFSAINLNTSIIA